MTCFIFDNSPGLFAAPGALCALVPAGVTEETELMRLLARELRLPAYFGNNWDALSDCLRDLSWINEHDVVLAHIATPALPAHDLARYIAVLSHAVKDWRPGDRHSLVVVFPLSERAQVTALEAGA